MPTFRELLRIQLRDLHDKCEAVEQTVFVGCIRADCIGLWSDDKLVKWLTKREGRFEKAFADVQKSLDELRKLLTMGENGEKDRWKE